jgi:hypothetical protein
MSKSIYYKYVRGLSPILNVLGGMLKFALISELNDPSEMFPIVDKVQTLSSLEILRRNGYSEMQMGSLRRQGALLSRLAPDHMRVKPPATSAQATALVRSLFFDNIDLLEKLLQDTAEQISNSVGVLCLTERYDSLPMWAHYADQAKGAIIILEDLEQAFSGDSTGVLNIPRAVRYDDERPGINFEPDSHENLFFSKVRDWSYEREVRIITPLDECDRTPDGIFVKRLPEKHIAGAILGWRMS